MVAGADCVAVAVAAAAACLAEFVFVRAFITLIAAFRADIRAVITKQAIAALIICTAFAAGLAAAGARSITVALAAASAGNAELGIIRALKTV